MSCVTFCSIEKSSVTSRIKFLTWCNINCLSCPEIHIHRQFICNMLSSRLFIPLSRSRKFLSHIYSGQNNIIFESLVLFLILSRPNLLKYTGRVILAQYCLMIILWMASWFEAFFHQWRLWGWWVIFWVNREMKFSQVFY